LKISILGLCCETTATKIMALIIHFSVYFIVTSYQNPIYFC
jgi:hypothetical protein